MSLRTSTVIHLSSLKKLLKLNLLDWHSSQCKGFVKMRRGKFWLERRNNTEQL